MSDRDYSYDSGAPQAPVPPPPSPEYRPRGGIGFGVLLIALGLLFLIVQFMPGVSLAQLWPLFIVLVGVVQIITPSSREGWGVHRVFDGIGTVIVGGVLLGNTTGFVSWSVWYVLLGLWPVLLIAVGFSILARAVGQSWLRLLSPVVIWLAFAYAVAASFTGAGGLAPVTLMPSAGGQAFDLSQPSGQVRSAALEFDGGAGDITLKSAPAGDLVTASGTSPFGAPEFAVDTSGTTADVRIGMASRKGVVIVPGFTAGHVDVGLATGVLWDATLQTGASSLSADLSSVRLKSLTLKTGASSDEIKLGPVPAEASKVPVVVKAGVSSVAITLPRDAQARIVSQSGLSSVDVGAGFVHQPDGSWQTPGFSASGRSYEIDVESGVGSVSVRKS
jgi:hypothetical protein